MRVIYKPKGRAKEYSFLALNPWGKSWCSHDCVYCYCPGMFRMSREQWRAQGFRPRANLLRDLEADAPQVGGTDKRVLLCFAGDLYSPEGVESGLPRQILSILREHDVPFQVLTKGGMRAAADFDLYGPKDAFATTLTTGGTEAWTWEPGAAGPATRIQAISEAHKAGIETWVSLEPVIDPDWSLRLIEMTWHIVDLYKIGKLNHDPKREAEVDWRAFGIKAIELCEKYGKPYYIKDDLAKYLDGVEFTNTDTRIVQCATPIDLAKVTQMLDARWNVKLWKNPVGTYTALAYRLVMMDDEDHETDLSMEDLEDRDVEKHITDDFTPEQALTRLAYKVLGEVI